MTKTSAAAKKLAVDAEPNSGGILAIARALQVIEILAEENGGLSLSELARRLDVNKQVATRITESLEAAGFIFRHAASEQLFLSYRVCSISERMLHSARLLEQCNAVLRTLADATGELARLAVVEKETLLWVLAAASTKHMLQINPLLTPSIKLHGTATGKAWLASLPDAHARAILRMRGLEAWTPKTVTDLGRIIDDLAEVRTRGWASSIEESEPGVIAIAAPIMIVDLDHQMRCVGTISLAAPTNRMNCEALTAVAPLVVDAANHTGKMWPISATDQVRAELSGGVRLKTR